MSTENKADPKRFVEKDVHLMYVTKQNETIDRNNLRVHLSNTFNRLSLPDTHAQNLERVWSNKLTVNPSLWNGTKFRLHSIDSRDGKTTFNIGVTCYKDFIGSNWSPDIKLLHELGEKTAGNSQAYLSDALGVGAMVVTADNKMILMRRSKHCGEAVGLLDIPGGHPEPKSLVGKIPMEEINVESLDPKAVVKEIFDSTLEEIISEVNIPAAYLSDASLLGVARNTTSGGRPSSEYIVTCSLTSTEIEKLYRQGSQSEAEETTSIQFVDMSDIPQLHLNQKLWPDLAPSAKGCIMLYQQYKQ